MTDSTSAGGSPQGQESSLVGQALERLKDLIASGPSDLHIHTTHSDGYESPAQVVQHVLSNRLAVFAVADHDTVRGVEDIQKILHKLDLMAVPRPVFVPGVELSAAWMGREIHLLAYFPVGGEWRLAEFLQKQQDTRNERNRLMCGKLAAEGCPISYDELAAEGGTTIGRMHMATILVRKGFSLNTEVCFEEWIGDGKKGFVERKLEGAASVIQVIRDAGGVPVLAHPAHYCWTGLEDGFLRQRLAELQELGLEGVETIHGNASKEQMEEIARISRELGLLRTAGSDYHANAGYQMTLLRSDLDYRHYLK